MYSDQDVANIKQLASDRFAALIQPYVGADIKVDGHGSFRCPCPIHRGRDKNFTWNAQQQYWKCRSICGTYGDVFEVILQLGLAHTFGDAVEWAASFVNFGHTSVPIERPKHVVTKQLVPLEESELKWVTGTHAQWNRITPAIKDYLEGGYGWARQHMLHRRLTLPVRDADGVLVGVTGRCTWDWKNDPIPETLPRFVQAFWRCKYLHFGASKRMASGRPSGTFEKSLVLYHYHRAKHYREFPLLVVEGPFDVAKAVEHGWHSVVALQGTDISPEQAAVLATHSHLVMGFDNDTAGCSARVRLRTLLSGSHCRLSELQLRDNTKDIGESTSTDFWKSLEYGLQKWDIL